MFSSLHTLDMNSKNNTQNDLSFQWHIHLNSYTLTIYYLDPNLIIHKNYWPLSYTMTRTLGTIIFSSSFSSRLWMLGIGWFLDQNKTLLLMCKPGSSQLGIFTQNGMAKYTRNNTAWSLLLTFLFLKLLTTFVVVGGGTHIVIKSSKN